MIAIVAHWVNAIATATLVVVGIWAAIATQNALQLSERAWVSPLGAQIRALPAVDIAKDAPTSVYVEKDKPIYFYVILNNSGREPALNLNTRLLNYTIDGYDPKRTTLASISVPENTACENLQPEEGRPPIAPSSPSYNMLSSVFGEPSFTADEKVVSGEKVYVIVGCSAYLTFGSVHRSGFCYMFETGHVVNTVPNAAPTFVPCNRGFSMD